MKSLAYTSVVSLSKVPLQASMWTKTPELNPVSPVLVYIDLKQFFFGKKLKLFLKSFQNLMRLLLSRFGLAALDDKLETCPFILSGHLVQNENGGRQLLNNGYRVYI